MRKLMNWLAVAAMVSTLATGCGEKDGDDTKKDQGAPVITMVGADIDAVHEITPTMSVKVNVNAPAGIKEFEIDIDSKPLKTLLPAVGLAEHMDLVNPATPAMSGALKNFGFPVEADVTANTDLSFDISTLVPLIGQIYKATGDHKFTLTVTDAKAQKTVKTLMFHTTGPTVTYNEDADLWQNTATLTITLEEAPVEPALEYKKSTETVWQKVSLSLNSDESYTAKIAPEWKAEANHASGAKQYSLDGKTGVFAGYTYNYRVVNNGAALSETEGTFAAAAGQKIPGGSMDHWGKLTVKDGEDKDVEIDCATADDGSSFWASGNNFMTPVLCQPETSTGTDKVAKLKGTMALGVIFAAGNFFSGVFDFDYEAYNGYARFGQKYVFTARPRALKLRYRATVGLIDEAGLRTDVKKGDPDRGRIFVCITDWTTPHSVMSGLGAMQDPTAINAFDPEKDAVTTEGNIMAYGVKWITANAASWTEIEIPIIYKETAREGKPKNENYSLVFSAASSAYGDYLCGSLANELYLDKIEWVY